MKKKATHFLSSAKVQIGLIVGVFLILGSFVVFSSIGAQTYVANGVANVEEVIENIVSSEPEKVSFHLETPNQVKAIYMTSCVAGTPSFRDKLIKIMDETEVNSVVIDIKDYTGTISYNPTNPNLDHMWENARCGTSDMEELIATLHSKDIYVIGRVTVFQDPHLTSRQPELAVKFASDGSVWKDNKGLSFTDVSSKEVWDYHVAIAKDAYGIGFDEINFDYIRFPSDGPMKDIYFPFSKDTPKAVALEKFFKYLDETLDAEVPDLKTSADLFGMVTTNTDDLNIGQVLERALPHFDYIAPMVYPSHYPKTFNGWDNPNNYPYELIKFVMSSAVARAESTTSEVETSYTKYVPAVMDDPETLDVDESRDGYYTKPSFPRTKLRTWIQDFDYGGDYGMAEVKAQIKGSYDAGVDSWMIWDPGNTYTVGALEIAS